MPLRVKNMLLSVAFSSVQLLARVKVAVLGVGRWGRNHVRVVKSLEREGIAELVCIHDIDLGRARTVANEFGVQRVCESIDDLEKLGVEAAIIATSIESLAEVSRRVASMGINVLVEKPVATKLEDLRELRRIVESRGLVAVPGFIMRFSAVVAKLRSIASSLGVYYAIFRRLSRRPPHMRRYPLALDLAIHDVDLCSYVLNLDELRIVDVHRAVLGIDELLVMVLEGKGTRCLVHVDGLSLAKVREIELVGENAFARCNTDDSTIMVRKPDGSYIVEKVVGEEPLLVEDRAFLKLVRGEYVDEQRVVPTLRDAERALSIVLTCVDREFGR